MDAVTSRVVADTLPADFAARVLTDACATAAPITQPTRLPVVLFSHGLGATRFSSASLFEELASHGFVVAAIHHTYGSQVTVFADGTAVPWDERQWATPHDVERNADVWVADAESVLDLLPTLDRRPGFPLAGRLDLSRVGYAGHSFGGNAAVRTALRDARVRAVVDLDGRLIGKGLGKPVTLRVPLLALFNPKSDSGHDFAVVPSATVVRVPGTAHESFTDAPLLAHLGPSPAKPSAEGMIDAERAISLTRAAVLNFFDCALRGDAAACTRERQALAGAGALPFTR